MPAQAAARQIDPRLALQNLKNLNRGLTCVWSRIYTTRMVSITSYSLKDASLKTASTVGAVGRTHFLSTGEG